jgi:hypothetical protein
MMTKEQIQSAIDTGQPFRLRMADGREYEVKHRDYIWLTPGAPSVIVGDDKGHFTILPLLTMSGLHSKAQLNGQ